MHDTLFCIVHLSIFSVARILPEALPQAGIERAFGLGKWNE